MQNLLNLTIVSQVTQLEEENPGFLSTQIEGLNRNWVTDCESIQALIEGDDNIAACEILHKIAGHVQMIGFSSLGEHLLRLELDIMTRSLTGNLTSILDDLTKIKTQSLNALGSRATTQ